MYRQLRIQIDEFQQLVSNGVDFCIQRIPERIDLQHFLTVEFSIFLLQRLKKFVLRAGERRA